jgi:hypothetical protein
MMFMTMASSIVDGSIVAVGVIGVFMMFVASLRGVDAPIMANIHSDAAGINTTVKRAA